MPELSTCGYPPAPPLATTAVENFLPLPKIYWKTVLTLGSTSPDGLTRNRLAGRPGPQNALMIYKVPGLSAGGVIRIDMPDTTHDAKRAGSMQGNCVKLPADRPLSILERAL